MKKREKMQLIEQQKNVAKISERIKCTFCNYAIKMLKHSLICNLSLVALTGRLALSARLHQNRTQKQTNTNLHNAHTSTRTYAHENCVHYLSLLQHTSSYIIFGCDIITSIHTVPKQIFCVCFLKYNIFIAFFLHLFLCHNRLYYKQ